MPLIGAKDQEITEGNRQKNLEGSDNSNYS